jgi:hypothetical protein
MIVSVIAQARVRGSPVIAREVVVMGLPVFNK